MLRTTLLSLATLTLFTVRFAHAGELVENLASSGGHTNGPNWPTFLTFASRHFLAK